MKRHLFLKSITASGAAMALPQLANAGTTHQVTIQDFKFVPDNLAVAVGIQLFLPTKTARRIPPPRMTARGIPAASIVGNQPRFRSWMAWRADTSAISTGI